MFYVKSELNPETTIHMELHDDNVYCSCPECGCEVAVDIADVFRGGEGDLYSTSVFCATCTDKRSVERRAEEAEFMDDADEIIDEFLSGERTFDSPEDFKELDRAMEETTDPGRIDRVIALLKSEFEKTGRGAGESNLPPGGAQA